MGVRSGTFRTQSFPRDLGTKWTWEPPRTLHLRLYLLTIFKMSHLKERQSFSNPQVQKRPKDRTRKVWFLETTETVRRSVRVTLRLGRRNHAVEEGNCLLLRIGETVPVPTKKLILQDLPRSTSNRGRGREMGSVSRTIVLKKFLSSYTSIKTYVHRI